LCEHIGIPRELLEHLIQQAELADLLVTDKSRVQLEKRVEELELELNGTKYRQGYKQMFAQCNRDYASINSENQSYRRILAFYGNPYKYVSGEIEKDEGKKARRILEEWK